MATIQSKKSRGHKYWYIVESRRINGKPRPVVLAYLGKAEDLLKRLQGLYELNLKSYSHGAVCALIDVAGKLDIINILNNYVKSSREYMAEKPVRNNLTAGATLLLGAIGRVCTPTSKMGWWSWARTTSAEYLLRSSLSKVDSQHFWDLMDSFPEDAIELAEQEILLRLFESYQIQTDTLFYDTTNFFTYIDTTNTHCSVAQRGKNKQKRTDLRQVGLAMVVSKEDHIPLLHHTYQGNLQDCTVFEEVAGKIKTRMQSLGLSLEKHSLVFDRGNNSKKNLDIVKQLGLYYVAALTPYHHKDIIEKSTGNMSSIKLNGNSFAVYREKSHVWGDDRTILVFVSDRLKAGQIRGIYQSLDKKEEVLKKLQQSLVNPKTKKRDKEKLEEQIRVIVKGQFLKDVIKWKILEAGDGKFLLNYNIDTDRLQDIENNLGFRIIMTNRHDWTSKEIITAYYGQSKIEHTFKNLKNPYHLTMRPQYHWTDQKIKVHNFICTIGYLLSSIIWREAKLKADYAGNLDNLLDLLNNVRLATILEESKKTGKPKATYKLEKMSPEEEKIIKALGIENTHNEQPKIRNVGVYKQNGN
ncbi:IS1634 family transposase [Patescibacteria group bacterium]|nr:IS1634 family transposase [Bacteroidota bacterium]MBU1721157.1 IS1634 family transposase [Patescibacteria group bacterium]